MFSGLELSTGYLISSILISAVGFALFVYGKKQLRTPQLVAGIALMALPVFLSDPLVLDASSAVALVGLWLWVRAGG